MNESIKQAAQFAAAVIGARKWARYNMPDAPDGLLQAAINSASVVVLDRWCEGQKVGIELAEYDPETHNGMAAYRVFGDGRVRSLLKEVRV